MTAVELIHHSAPHVSTYEWRVAGTLQLSEFNKLSSFPFWFPSDADKRHQFRFVLLKHLAPTAAPDTIGLVVEVIPPPPDPQTGSSEELGAYPGGCTVSVNVQSQQIGVPDITASLSVLLDHDNPQACFAELIPAASVETVTDFTADPSIVTLRVTIESDVSLIAHQVAKSVVSMWSFMKASVANLVDRSLQVYHEQRRQSPPPAVRYAPWDVIPPKWADRKEAWRQLVSETAGEDEGWFLYGPHDDISVDARNALLEVGLNFRLLRARYGEFEAHRDVHEGLLTSAAIRRMRYRLVPKRLKDDDFWGHYYWKVNCLRDCDTQQQAQTVLSILNAPPHVQPKGTTVPAASSPSEEHIMAQALEAQEAAALLQELLQDGGSNDGAVLMVAAAEACEDHMQRLGAFVRQTDLTEDTSRAVGAALHTLRDHLGAFEALRAQACPPDPQPAAVPVPPVVKTEEVQSIGKESLIESSAPSAPRAESVSFPKMPWEDDDD